MWAVIMKVTFLLHWISLRLRKLILTYNPSYCEGTVKSKFEKFGVRVDGDRPCDLRVYDSRFFREVAHDTAMGLAEAYMHGYWVPNNFSAFFDTILKNGDDIFNAKHGRQLWKAIVSNVFHSLTGKIFRVKPEPTTHFNKDIYEAFLGSTMSFSCGYWVNANNLEEAQTNKLELLARKLKIKPGMTVLDIGCGWGTLARYLAAKYDAKIVGCTLHPQQGEYARKVCAGLYVDIQVMHCEQIQGKFDRIISVGRFCLIGRANYHRFFKFVARCLNDDGIFLLDTIGVNHPNVRLSDPWTQKYLFPGLEYPYHTDISKCTDGLFVLEGWANLGFHYSKTLEAWLTNLEQPKLEKMFGSHFYRMWKFFLHRQSSAFRLRKLQLWQIILTKNGFPGGYEQERVLVNSQSPVQDDNGNRVGESFLHVHV